ncbi:MAG: HAMP domain-containing histidine kinase [Elusimicrobia bacterium]|nr:HAMP domain-containing histidine kinase [Elusimicrobiota bacterium]
MSRSLVTALTLAYVRAALVVVLVLALGVAVAQIVAFSQRTKLTAPAARDETATLLTSQLRAGRSLSEAAQYTADHLKRPNFYLYVASGPHYTTVFQDRPNAGPRQAAGNLILLVLDASGAVPKPVARTGTVPGGFFALNVNAYRLVDDIVATYLYLVPFILVALVVVYFIARAIAGRALRPVLEMTHALNDFADGNFTALRVPANEVREVRALDAAYNAAAARAQRTLADREIAAENVRTFIADASHELKTPLTIIMGYLGAIAEGVVTNREDEQRVLAKTLAECRRMRDTIGKLISLARLDREPVDATPVDVAALTREAAETMKPLAPELHVQVPAGHMLVLGNAAELREALICIIDNAVKYAPSSPIDVQVTRTGDVAVVEVADAGPGMNPEDREHAFERFRRGGTNADVEGSGLGLAIAKRAAERANGRIALSSELGRGTTVKIYLPIASPNGVAGAQSV